jgi:hypothetical protein
MAEKLKALERENRELRQANDKAALFAGSEGAGKIEPLPPR